MSFVINHQLLFAFIRNSSFFEFKFKCFLINGFEETRTEFFMNLHSSTNNLVAFVLVNYIFH